MCSKKKKKSGPKKKLTLSEAKCYAKWNKARKSEMEGTYTMLLLAEEERGQKFTQKSFFVFNGAYLGLFSILGK